MEILRKKFFSALRYKLIFYFLLCGGMTVLWIFVSESNFSQSFDSKIYDLFMMCSRAPAEDSAIVAVEYDDKTAENLLQFFSYRHLAVLIDLINRGRPKVIALDLFSLSSFLQGVDTAGILEEMIYGNHNVVEGIGLSVTHGSAASGRSLAAEHLKSGQPFLCDVGRSSSIGSFFRAEQYFSPFSENRLKAKCIGHLVLNNDPDGICRKIPIAVIYGDDCLINLGVQAVLEYLEVKPSDVFLKNGLFALTVPGRQRVVRIPLDDHGQMSIWFNDRRDSIREISMIDVMRAMKDSSNSCIPSVFKDKIVFIGNTSSRTGRFCATPIHRYYPTLLVHANAANNVLQGKIVAPFGKEGLGLIFVILFIIFFAFGTFNRLPGRILWLLFIIPMIGIGAFYLFRISGRYLPVFGLSSYCGATIAALFITLSISRLRAMNRAQMSLLISIERLEQTKNELNDQMAQMRNTLSDTERELRKRELLAQGADHNAAAMHQIKNEIGILVQQVKNAYRGSGNFPEVLKGLVNRTSKTYEYCEDMLRFIRSSSVKLNKTIFPLAQTIRICLDSYGDLIEVKKIVIKMNGVDEKMTVFADKDRIIDVLTNLFKNAIEAAPESGEIEIAATLNVDSIVLVICDNGPGIPENKIASIFEPFFTFGKKKGTGLGLAIVKQFVELHGGKIAVESPPGRGARFTLWLPTDKSEHR